MSDRGRTGTEGKTVKAYSLIAAAVGLGWLGFELFIAEPAGSIWRPIVLTVLGIIVFLVGRGMKK